MSTFDKTGLAWYNKQTYSHKVELCWTFSVHGKPYCILLYMWTCTIILHSTISGNSCLGTFIADLFPLLQFMFILLPWYWHNIICWPLTSATAVARFSLSDSHESSRVQSNLQKKKTLIIISLCAMALTPVSCSALLSPNSGSSKGVRTDRRLLLWL